MTELFPLNWRCVELITPSVTLFFEPQRTPERHGDVSTMIPEPIEVFFREIWILDGSQATDLDLYNRR